jgi:hypothetical protein
MLWHSQVVSEPNGEPKSLMILAMAGLFEASRGTGTQHCQRVDSRRPCLAENAELFLESSRPRTPSPAETGESRAQVGRS